MSVIEGGEKVDSKMISNYTKHTILQKCIILTLALNLTLEQMNGWAWSKYCETALKVAVRMGVSITKNADTVKRWYHSFRVKRRFTVPTKQKHNLPPFLELNPDVCSALKSYTCANLNKLSIETDVPMVEFLVDACELQRKRFWRLAKC